jgi:hypothetical protein
MPTAKTASQGAELIQAIGSGSRNADRVLLNVDAMCTTCSGHMEEEIMCGERGIAFPARCTYVDGGVDARRWMLDGAKKCPTPPDPSAVADRWGGGQADKAQVPSGSRNREGDAMSAGGTSPVRQGRFETSNRPERILVSDRDTHVQSPVHDCPDHWCASVQRPEPEHWVRPLALTQLPLHVLLIAAGQ